MTAAGRRATAPANALSRSERWVLAVCCGLIALLILLTMAGIVATEPKGAGQGLDSPPPRSAPVADFVPDGNRSDSLFS